MVAKKMHHRLQLHLHQAAVPVLHHPPHQVVQHGTRKKVERQHYRLKLIIQQLVILLQ